MNETIAIVLRYVHLVSAIMVVGGMCFISWCLWPTTRQLDDSTRSNIDQAALKRFQRIVYIGIIGLLGSGIYGWIRNNDTYTKMKFTGQGLLGIKVLLAAIIFTVVIAKGLGLIKPSRFWHMFNLHLAAVVILLAVIIHQSRIAYYLAHLLPG